MALPIETLIEPVADDMPCGQDPAEHDNVYQALQQSIKGRVEYKLVGDDEISIYQPPAWQKVYDDALQCASRTRDIRVCIMLLRGAAGCHGLSGLVSGLGLLRETCARFWDELYPAINESAATPSEQLVARVAALGELTNREGLLRDLQDMPILEARGLGRFGLRQINLARGKISPKANETAPEAGLVEASLAKDLDLGETLRLIGEARGELDSLTSDLRDRLGAEAPDFSPLGNVLAEMAEALGGDRTGNGQAEDAERPSGEQAASSAAAPAGDAGGTGELQNREQVIAALDRILAYYSRLEPASPIPLLIRRARRLVPMDFLALMEDLAPASVKQLKEIGGVEKSGGAAKNKNGNPEE
ncbi:MAG: type VI secretion system protein TssA [Geminicoccaceae bacterium]